MIVRDQGDLWPELSRPTTATRAAQAYRQAPVDRRTIEAHDGGTFMNRSALPGLNVRSNASVAPHKPAMPSAVAGSMESSRAATS